MLYFSLLFFVFLYTFHLWSFFSLFSVHRYVYNQVISVVTLSRLTKIFEQKCNYDLRRLLSGSERLIDQLLVFMETDYAFLLGAVRVLPLAPTARDDISNIIVSACSKIKVSYELIFYFPFDVLLILKIVNYP